VHSPSNPRLPPFLRRSNVPDCLKRHRSRGLSAAIPE